MTQSIPDNIDASGGATGGVRGAGVIDAMFDRLQQAPAPERSGRNRPGSVWSGQKAYANILPVDGRVMDGLAAKLILNGGKRSGFQIGFTAPRAGEGVTTMVANLALTLSQRFKKRVVMVEVNLARPCLATMFNMAEEPGLTEFVTGAQAPANCVHFIDENLYVVPAGRSTHAPAAVLDDPRFETALELLKGRFDVALFDCPPIEQFGETAIVAERLESMVMVLSAEGTRAAVAQRAVEDLRVAGARISGVVLNRQRRYVPDWLYRML